MYKIVLDYIYIRDQWFSDHGDEELDSTKDGKFLCYLNSSLWRKMYFVPHVMKYVAIYCVLDPC
jgi:hypothetical protein